MTRSRANDRLYDGCKVLHPNGELMFRCDKKRANWYLKRDLAILIEPDPLTIRLTFEPKGPGHIGDNFYLQERKNVCSVCGSKKNLSRHHVVPHCYVRAAPDKPFHHNSHDVVPMCVECHEKYEHIHSHQLRQKLAEQYDAPVNGNGAIVFRRSVKAAVALMCHGVHMPEYRQKELRAMIAQELDHSPSDQEIKDLSAMSILEKNEDFKTHGEIVMSKVTNVNEFVRIWRNHFLETMKPQHLPEHWDANRRLGRPNDGRSHRGDFPCSL